MKHQTHIEIPITVFYDLQPFEPATATYPGCAAEIQNVCVAIGKKPHEVFIEDSLSVGQCEAIITEIQESIAAEHEGID